MQFLGGVAYPKIIYPSMRIKRNYRKAVLEYTEGKRPVDSLVSYHGHVIHFAHNRIERKIFDEAGW